LCDLKGAPRILKAPARGAVFSQDGKTLFCGKNLGGIMIWDFASAQPELRCTLPMFLGIESLALSPDNETLAVAAADGTVFFLRAPRGK
jgi:WD40 repeat protein